MTPLGQGSRQRVSFAPSSSGLAFVRRITTCEVARSKGAGSSTRFSHDAKTANARSNVILSARLCMCGHRDATPRIFPSLIAHSPDLVDCMFEWFGMKSPRHESALRTAHSSKWGAAAPLARKPPPWKMATDAFAYLPPVVRGPFFVRALPSISPKSVRLCSTLTSRSRSFGTRPEYSLKPPPQHPPKRPDATSLRVCLSTTTILGDFALGWNV